MLNLAESIDKLNAATTHGIVDSETFENLDRELQGVVSMIVGLQKSFLVHPLIQKRLPEVAAPTYSTTNLLPY